MVLSLQRKYKVLRKETTTNLRKLSGFLQDSYRNWVHLTDGAKEVLWLMEQELKCVPYPEINHKWKVYPGTYAEDVLDWIDLYHDEYFEGRADLTKNVNKFYEDRGMGRLKL